MKFLFSLPFKVLTPPRCLGCDKLGGYFCRQCLSRILLIDKQKCPVCERQSPGGATHPRCCGRFTLDGLLALFEYQGIIKQAVKQLKFHGLIDIREEITRMINQTFRFFYNDNLLAEFEDFIVYDKPVVVPIPLYWWRQHRRGFNQAEFLAEIFAYEYNLPVLPKILVRAKNTKPQTELEGKERESNVKESFAIRANFLREDAKIDQNLNNILLVDDVVTTGATLKSAANILKRQGVKKVWGLTLAA